MKIPLLFALIGTLSTASWAQAPNDVLVPTTQQSKRMFKFTLKKVTPSLMAYWLDPKNHQAPEGFRGDGQTLPVPPQFAQVVPLTGSHSETFQLPEGVDRIVAVDPQNALLVFGTPQGVGNLASTIAFLDRPMRQVEIEAKYISLPTDDIQKLIPNFSDATTQIWRGNFDSSLASLQKQHKAVVMMAPRVVAINNLTASLSRTLAQPIKMTGARKGDALPDAVESKELSLETTQGLEVTPTINNDDTVTLLTHIKRSVQLKNSETTNSLLLEEDPDQEVIVNVRDGETFALPQKQTPEQAKTSRRTVLLITTRLARRPEQP